MTKKSSNQFRGGMSEMLRQANRLQRKIESRRTELKTETVEASSGNDMVKVVANGAREIVRITLDPELLKKEESELVLDMVVAACNAALNKASEMVEAELEKVAGGRKIPGLT